MDISKLRKSNKPVSESGEASVEETFVPVFNIPIIPTETQATSNAITVVDDPIEKRKLILDIRVFITAFDSNELIQPYKKMNYDKMSNQQLVEIRKEMEKVLTCRSAARVGPALILGVINHIEKGCKKWNWTKDKYNIDGLTRVMSTEEAVQDMQLLGLKYLGGFESSPEARLGFKLIYAIMLLNDQNTSNDKKQPSEVPNVVPSAVPSADNPDNDNIEIDDINEQYSEI